MCICRQSAGSDTTADSLQWKHIFGLHPDNQRSSRSSHFTVVFLWMHVKRGGAADFPPGLRCALTVHQVSSRQMLQHGASCLFYLCRSDVINIRFARLRLQRNKTASQIRCTLPLNPRLYCKPAAVRPAAALRL